MTRAYGISDNSRLHFVTFTIVQWIKIFKIENYCRTFLDSVKYCQKNKGLKVYAWCIMPNHVHMIIGAKDNAKLENIIRDLKSYTSRKVHLLLEERSNIDLNIEDTLNRLIRIGRNNRKNKDFQLWQQPYHAVELSTNEMMDQRLDYIHNNPVKAGLVDVQEEWAWSSATDYYGGKGLLEITYLE
jgi:REP element-mobilizing transposase RayT